MPSTSEACLLHAMWYLKSLERANELFRTGGEAGTRGLNQFELDRAQIENGYEWSTQNSKNKRHIKVLCYQFPLVGEEILIGHQLTRDRIDWLRTGLIFSKQLKEKPATAKFLNSIGYEYSFVGKKKLATSYYEKALAIYREIDNLAGVAEVLWNQADLMSDLAEYDQALELVNQAFSLNKRIKKIEGIASDLELKGWIYYAKGEPVKSIIYSRRAIACYSKLGDQPGLGRALSNLGNANLDLGKPNEALLYLEKATQIDHQYHDKSNEAVGLLSLGDVYITLREIDKAIDLIMQALDVHKQFSDVSNEATALYKLGQCYRILNNYEKSLHYLEESSKMFQALDDIEFVGRTYHEIGQVYLAQENVEQALIYLENAIKIARNCGQKSSEALASWSLGELYKKLGKTEKALELMKIRIDYENSIGHAEAKKHAMEVDALP